MTLSPTIRGIDARVHYANYLVACTVHGNDSLDSFDCLFEALQEAESEGRRDYHHNRELPVLFQDVPQLARSWNEGFEASACADEMQCCSGCQDSRGDPCPSHG